MSCVLLTGCSSIGGVTAIDVDKEYSKAYIETERETVNESSKSATKSGEGLLYEESNKKSLSDISVSGDNSNTSGGSLTVPKRPTKQVYETETQTTSYETYAVATLEYETREETVPIETTVAESTVDYGNTPEIYYSSFGEPTSRTDINLLDVDGIKKDAYGNYIVPYSTYGNQNVGITNERGKIPYIFYYDSLGNIINPFPDELKNYKNYYELGYYTDDAGNKHLLPIIEIK